MEAAPGCAAIGGTAIWTRCCTRIGAAAAIFCLFHEIEDRLHGEGRSPACGRSRRSICAAKPDQSAFSVQCAEAIRSDALLADCEDIAERPRHWRLFRYTISNVQEYVTFSDELDNAENYFTIQRCRFGDKLDMELKWKTRICLRRVCPS